MSPRIVSPLTGVAAVSAAAFLALAISSFAAEAPAKPAPAKTPAAATPAAAVAASAPVPTLKDPAEQKALEAILTRFSGTPTVKDGPKGMEVAAAGLKDDPKGGGSASVAIDKASGHVLEVTSNGAKLRDEEVAAFAAFPELRGLTLWHNSGGFTGTGLAALVKLPKIDHLTLAGGGLNDAGMAEVAKFQGLKALRAWHSGFTDVGIAALRNHPSLEAIKIGPMWDSTLTDKSLESLSTCPKLKSFGISETWLTWEGGLKHLVKLKGTLKEIDLGNSIIEPADVERLKKEMPDAKIEWGGINSGREELKKGWIKPKAEKWIPKELLQRATAD
jgi:hypothetical protein